MPNPRQRGAQLHETFIRATEVRGRFSAVLSAWPPGLPATCGAGRTRGGWRWRGIALQQLNVFAVKDKWTGADHLSHPNLFFPYFKAFCVASWSAITLEVFQTRSDTGKIALPDNGSPQLCLINYVVGHETGFLVTRILRPTPYALAEESDNAKLKKHHPFDVA